jgi:hypothetical protein
MIEVYELIIQSFNDMTISYDNGYLGKIKCARINFLTQYFNVIIFVTKDAYVYTKFIINPEEKTFYVNNLNSMLEFVTSGKYNQDAREIIRLNINEDYSYKKFVVYKESLNLNIKKQINKINKLIQAQIKSQIKSNNIYKDFVNLFKNNFKVEQDTVDSQNKMIKTQRALNNDDNTNKASKNQTDYNIDNDNYDNIDNDNYDNIDNDNYDNIDNDNYDNIDNDNYDNIDNDN